MKKLTKILAGIAIASTLTIGAAAFAGCNDNKDTTKDLGTAEGAQGFATATAAMSRLIRTVAITAISTIDTRATAATRIIKAARICRATSSST